MTRAAGPALVRRQLPKRRPAVAIPKGGFLMYIGVGTVVFILVIVLIIYFVRRT